MDQMELETRQKRKGDIARENLKLAAKKRLNNLKLTAPRSEKTPTFSLPLTQDFPPPADPGPIRPSASGGAPFLSNPFVASPLLPASSFGVASDPRGVGDLSSFQPPPAPIKPILKKRTVPISRVRFAEPSSSEEDIMEESDAEGTEEEEEYPYSLQQRRKENEDLRRNLKKTGGALYQPDPKRRKIGVFKSLEDQLNYHVDPSTLSDPTLVIKPGNKVLSSEMYRLVAKFGASAFIFVLTLAFRSALQWGVSKAYPTSIHSNPTQPPNESKPTESTLHHADDMGKNIESPYSLH